MDKKQAEHTLNRSPSFSSVALSQFSKQQRRKSEERKEAEDEDSVICRISLSPFQTVALVVAFTVLTFTAFMQLWTYRNGDSQLRLSELRLEDVQPLPNTHSHNDYMQKRPLVDAIEAGICSIEADVHISLFSRSHHKLFLGHIFPSTETLQDKYLEPLAHLAVQRKGKSLYAKGGCPQTTLMLDLKTAPIETWDAIDNAILKINRDAGFDIFQCYDGDVRSPDSSRSFSSSASFRGTEVSASESNEGVTLAPIRVVVSGIRVSSMKTLADRMLTKRKDGRFCSSMDGRFESDLLEPSVTRDSLVLRVTSMISERWTSNTDVRARAHVAKSLDLSLRFWNTPDTPKFWTELLKETEGADLIIGSDNIGALKAFKAGLV